MNIIRKGQIRWLPKTDVVGQAQFIRSASRLRSISLYVSICDTTCDRA
jgi:hypothetical protein